MSFNIWGGSQSKETARVILDNGTPDIVAVQELTPQMATTLLKEVGDIYPYRAFQTGPRNEGMGVLSRYPLVELETSYLDAPE